MATMVVRAELMTRWYGNYSYDSVVSYQSTALHFYPPYPFPLPSLITLPAFHLILPHTSQTQKGSMLVKSRCLSKNTTKELCNLLRSCDTFRQDLQYH